MKTKIIILLFIIASFTACEDKLDQIPPSDLSVDGFFQTEDDIIQAVNGVYQILQTYPDRQYYLSDVRSDNFYAVSESGVRDHDPVNNFAKTLNTNVYLKDTWNYDFEGIMRANTVLENINADAIPDEDLKLRLEAEVKFLRAFLYFDLVRCFGKVPLIDKVVLAEEALTIGRSDVSSIYDLIISDLNFAITNLDDYYAKGSENRGRATKDAARGILARVYLTRSGDDFGIEGPGLGTNEYQEALDLLNTIIDNSAGRYSLIEDYASIFALSNENNEEIIWDIQYISGGLGVGASYPGEMGGQAYWKAKGFTESIGLETKDVSEYLIGQFDTVNDTRFAASIELSYIDVTSAQEVYDPTCSKFCSSNPSDWGQDRFDFPINFPILRYSDVLLMKAECILQGASGSQTEVNDIINSIRERAGIDPLSNDATLDDLLDERQKEFLGEALRWHDLVRTGRVLDVINEWIPVEDIREQMRQNYPIQAYNIIYPVPLTQIEVKKGLYEQNDGYE